MGLFNNLTNDGLEESQDRLGGGYAAKESDIYTGKIKAFYAGESSGGAKSVTVILSEGDFDTEYRETIYITKKTGENFFLNKNDKTKKIPLPGFTIIDDMCLATIGKPLSEVDFEDKVMNIWDPEERKELPKSVPMAVEILGQEISVAIQKSIENQTEKDSNGNYVPKADGSTRDVNNIDKVFNTATKKTVAEARAGAETPEFWDKWLEKNKGSVRDNTTKVEGNSGRPGGSAPQGGGNSSGGNAPRSSLFGKK